MIVCTRPRHQAAMTGKLHTSVHQNGCTEESAPLRLQQPPRCHPRRRRWGCQRSARCLLRPRRPARHAACDCGRRGGGPSPSCRLLNRNAVTNYKHIMVYQAHGHLGVTAAKSNRRTPTQSYNSPASYLTQNRVECAPTHRDKSPAPHSSQSRPGCPCPETFRHATIFDSRATQWASSVHSAEK